VWDHRAEIWFPLERSYPAGTLLVGRQLENLTNGRYRSGRHLVRSHPDLDAKQPTDHSMHQTTYRHSIVFVLRAHSPVTVDTNDLTTPITGEFYKSMRGITAGDLFQDIHNAHFNINTGIQERGEQKQNLARMKGAIRRL
jgi:hypothetical protein